MTTFRVSLYGRESLPSVSEILAVFSWRVIRAIALHDAISAAIRETGEDAARWKWALVRYSRRDPNRIDAIRIVPKPEETVAS